MLWDPVCVQRVTGTDGRSQIYSSILQPLCCLQDRYDSVHLITTTTEHLLKDPGLCFCLQGTIYTCLCTVAVSVFFSICVMRAAICILLHMFLSIRSELTALLFTLRGQKSINCRKSYCSSLPRLSCNYKTKFIFLTEKLTLLYISKVGRVKTGTCLSFGFLLVITLM